MPEGYDEPACTLCHEQLTYLGAAHTAEPFWQIINKFFTYPVQLSSLSFLFVSVVIGLLAPYTGPAEPILSLIMMAVLIKYSLQIIEAVSFGSWEPPSLEDAFSADALSLFFKQMAIFFVGGVALYFIGSLGWIAFFAALFFMLLGVPASTMILAREQSLFSAINPIKIAFVMAAIGWPYLLLYFFLIVLSGGPAYFIGFQLEPSPATVAASSFLGGYFSFVMYAMMGYCLYQYQATLGYTAEMEEFGEVSEEDYRKSKAMADSLILMREGREEEALKAVKAALTNAATDLQLNKRFFQLLMLTASDEILQKFVGKYTQRLLIVRKDHEAADIYLEVRKRLKAYMPATASDRFKLAKALSETGKARESLRLLFNMHKTFPDFAGIPEAYLLVAKMLSENMNNDEQARVYLDYVIKKYPDSRKAEEAKVFRHVIDKLATQTA
ncbi:hypothetical protein EOPP23_02230 [Endozoicomonas sp. OPT23]|nr:hypothetical protein [Endozoicomonas sp. OPT23]